MSKPESNWEGFREQPFDDRAMLHDIVTGRGNDDAATSSGEFRAAASADFAGVTMYIAEYGIR